MTNVSPELSPEIEFTPGKLPEFDDRSRSLLAKYILDETIEIPASNRGNSIMYSDYSDDDFIELYRPLVDILELDPSIDRPPLREHIDRASKLGITPSVGPIYDRMSLSAVHTGLGFKAKLRFSDWSQNELIEAGKSLAKKIGTRPTRDVITYAGRGEYRGIDDFPTVDVIKSRFGKISVFHELIGYPSCKGWGREDYLDWSYAFYKQNPGSQLSASLIGDFSMAGRGPSKQPILKKFGSIQAFKDISIENYRTKEEDDNNAKNSRLDDVYRLTSYDADLNELFNTLTKKEPEITRDRLLQVAAQYSLGKRLATTATVADLINGSQLHTPDGFAGWCISHSNGLLTVAGVETHASALGVFDDLWPMYRFENVALRIDKSK
ncbi:hypothetical protein KC946_03755 [Candidatus Saccharibacteria bacterium]|nr:hypothetical protein [Candidatus Saccharibacteria bacterium]